jgi:hypothetical protein
VDDAVGYDMADMNVDLPFLIVVNDTLSKYDCTGVVTLPYRLRAV